jgi:hypothetical protein
LTDNTAGNLTALDISGCTGVYIDVKLTWVIFVLGVAAITICAWKKPATVAPLTLGLAAAAVLAVILHL